MLAFMTRFDVDLFVLGGGSGGVRAGRVAAEHGARVAIAEADRWGGTCVIRGCVPKKLLVYASETTRTLEEARHNGWAIEPGVHDWSALVAAKDREITRLSQAYRNRLEKAGARVLAGRAVLVDPHTIEVEGERITAANILVAVGGTPLLLLDDPFAELDLGRASRVLGLLEDAGVDQVLLAVPRLQDIPEAFTRLERRIMHAGELS